MTKKNYNYFIPYEIDESIFRRISGVSFRPNPDIQVSDLSFIPILHYGFDRKIHGGEIICNKNISDRVIAIFKQLYDIQYKIKSIRLIDDYNGDDSMSMAANNSSCFNYRTISQGERLSLHALGLAIDINPLYNPYVKLVHGGQIVLPSEATPYIDRNRCFPHKISHNDSAYIIFTKYGFSWGGDWETIKDYQHFEIIP